MKQIEKVIIIGAGPAGIATALRLQRQNRALCVIYEIREEPTTLGGSIGIPANGLRLLSRLDLYDKLLEKGAETPDIVVHSHAGKTMGRIQMSSWSKQQTGFGYVRVRRTDFMDVMLAAADKERIPIHFNKRVIKIEEKQDNITASFSDGTSDTADLLIGADGIHSSVRKLHIDPECTPIYSGISNVFSMIPKSQLSIPAPLLQDLNATLTSDGMFAISPANPTMDLLYWFFSRELNIPASGDKRDGWEETSKREIENVKETILTLLGDEKSEWLDFLRDVVDHTDVVKFYPIFKLPPGRPWHKGRCLIIGDAAHAMPPHASQGVSMALEDVFLLSNLLKSSSNRSRSLEEMMNLYEEIRRVRTVMMLRTAERNGDVRKSKGPWHLWAYELILSGGLWLYWAAGLGKFGLGQKPLVYDVENERL